MCNNVLTDNWLKLNYKSKLSCFDGLLLDYEVTVGISQDIFFTLDVLYLFSLLNVVVSSFVSKRKICLGPSF